MLAAICRYARQPLLYVLHDRKKKDRLAVLRITQKGDCGRVTLRLSRTVPETDGRSGARGR